MDVTYSRTQFAGKIPPVETPAETDYQILCKKENIEDAKLLAQLSADCVSSYRWADDTFQAAMADRKGRSARTFVARRGSFWWRPFALIAMPLNYIIIVCSFVFLLELPVMLAAVVFCFAFDVPLLPWLTSIVFYYSAIVMAGFAIVAAFIGLVVAGCTAVLPALASARAFGCVAENSSTVTLVFCGSNDLDNLTINALVWPWYGPLRHAGFLRAWRHIRGDVEDWLRTALPEGGEIVLTGHSLGGALAQIAAYELPDQCDNRNYDIRHVVSFGSSRIGGMKMRKRYENCSTKPELHSRTRHITHATDAVPRLPPPLFYKHVGEGFTLSSAGDLYPGGAAPLYEEFLEISKAVSAVWSGQSADAVMFLHTTSGRPLSHDALEFLKLAERFSPSKWVSPVAAPLATLLFLMLAAYLYYIRSFTQGFSHHKRKLYRDALAVRLIKMNPNPDPSRPVHDFNRQTDFGAV
jgi:pimeloyl-ACP methyl ester carboxylesterase